MATVDDLFQAAMALNEHDRQQLLLRLQASLAPDDDEQPDWDAETRAAWLAEIDHRMAEYHAGREPGLPAKAVIEELLRELASDE